MKVKRLPGGWEVLTGSTRENGDGAVDKHSASLVGRRENQMMLETRFSDSSLRL